MKIPHREVPIYVGYMLTLTYTDNTPLQERLNLLQNTYKYQKIGIKFVKKNCG